MAAGSSNQGIADKLVITLRAVEKYVSSIFGKLGLPSTGSESRRVLAVLLYLRVLKTPENRPSNGKSPVFPARLEAVRLGRSPKREGDAVKTRIIQDEPEPTRKMPPSQRSNIAGRMARWSAHHRKKAIFGWLALSIALFAVSIVSPMKKIVFETSGPGESGRMDKILYEDFRQPAGEAVLIQSRTLTASDPAFQRTVQSGRRRGLLRSTRSRRWSHRSTQTTRARSRATSIRRSSGSSSAGIPTTPPDIIDPVVDRVDEVQKANPDFYIGSFGTSTGKAVEAGFFDDLKKAGEFSVPLTLIILVVAFGALVAAGIPLLLALTAVLGTLGIVALISQVLPMSESVSAIILLIGLAVGVDYTMFYLKREREERAKGLSEEAALEAAAATSGRSVLISGSTVIVAMAGMFLTGDSDFASFGAATITVVAVAMLGSLTVLPALLSKLGDNVDRLRVPFVHRLRRDDGEGRIWGAIIDRVLRRPALSAALAAGVLVALAVPGRPAPHGQREHRHVSAEPLEDVQPHEGRRSRARRSRPTSSSRRRTSKRRR